MINETAVYIAQILSNFFKEKLSLTEDPVIVNRLVNADGSIPPTNRNKLIFTLVNMEEDRLARNDALPNHGGTNVSTDRYSYNLYFLLTANLNDYLTSLKCLDFAIDFFKSYPLPGNSDTTALPPGIEKLICVLNPLAIEQLAAVYAVHGAKYQPAAYFKVSVRSIAKSQ